MTRTRMVACPACDGERGHWEDSGRSDRETGAPLQYWRGCTYCDESGGVEVALEPVTVDDLTMMDGSTSHSQPASGTEGGITSPSPDKAK